MFDIPLMLISMLVFGGGFGTRTVLAALYTPGFMNVLTRLVYPNPEAVESLDPSLLLGGRLDLSNDLLLTCVIGAVVIGIGQGIVVRQQATTGARTSWACCCRSSPGSSSRRASCWPTGSSCCRDWP